jgi:hypothetical protein
MDLVREKTCLQRQCTDHWVEEDILNLMIKRDVGEEAEESKLLLLVAPLLRYCVLRKRRETKKKGFLLLQNFSLFFLLVLFRIWL